ncbi:MAG: O-antigen ligase family protein [Candidatus Gastranaerophilaceae bacterium]|jgi:hypothetical protein
MSDFIITIGLDIPVFFIISSIFLLIIKPNYILNKLYQLYKSPFKYMFLFMLWVIIGIIISLITGKFDMSGVIYSFVGGLFFTILIPFLIANSAFQKIISSKKLIKLVFVVFFLIFLLGIIQFLGYFFNISIIKNFFYIIHYRTYFLSGLDSISIPMASGLPRINSTFGEPSFYGFFIIVTSPIVYFLSTSKYKLFKNIFTDRILKKMLFALMFLNLLLTQAPIYMLFGLVLLLIVLIKHYLNYIRSNLAPILIITGFLLLIFLGSLLVNFDKKNSTIHTDLSFVNRIVLTCETYKNFNAFVIAEPSLATRVLAYVGNITIWYKNPILGIGYGNLKKEMPKEIAKLPLPLTNELERRVLSDKQTLGITSSIFCKILAETGIVGVILFYSFLFRLLFVVKKTVNHYENIEKDFILGLKYFIILLIINTLYNSHPHWAFIWFFLGITQAMVIYANKSLKEKIYE